MTVTVTVTPVIDGRIVPGIPAGLEQWTAQGLVTAAAGSGTANLVVEFNSGSQRTFQPYVALQSVSVINQVTDIGDGFIFANSQDWERSFLVGTSISSQLGAIVLTNVDANIEVGHLRQWRHLGRVQIGTAGRLTTRFNEVDTATIEVTLTGLVSDRPFMLPSEWVV